MQIFAYTKMPHATSGTLQASTVIGYDKGREKAAAPPNEK